MNVKLRISGGCSVFVLGIDINCPMCGVLVKSGEQHSCKTIDAPKQLKPKASKLKPGETR